MSTSTRARCLILPMLTAATAACTDPSSGSQPGWGSGCVGTCGPSSGEDTGGDSTTGSGTETSGAADTGGGGESGAPTSGGGDTGGGETSGGEDTSGGTETGRGGETEGGGDCGGPSTDKNGVAYVQIPGFTYVGGVERFDWSKNFKSNGSMRHDFEQTPEGNQCVVGYFVVDGPANEEISAKLGGGPHNDTNPTWADTHDLGIINFVGDRSRVRWEATHPNYEGAETQDVNNIGDIRGDWVGAMGCKLNLDKNGDGEIDHIWYLAWVDPLGLDAGGKPENGWVKTLDVEYAVEDVDLKSPSVPYVTTIGQADEAQATLRIDEQDGGYEYDYIAYRSPIPCEP